MKRRIFCSGLLATGLAGVSTAAVPPGREASPDGSPGAGPRHLVSMAHLTQAVATRFPLRLEVEDLFHLVLQAPRLSPVPAQNRLRCESEIEAAGQALRHRYSGAFEADFLLRYEPLDQTVRAERPRVHALQLDRLPPRAAQLLSLYGPALAEQALQGLVLHRLAARDLVLPETMGLEPDTLSVSAQGLVVGFKPRTPRLAP